MASSAVDQSISKIALVAVQAKLGLLEMVKGTAIKADQREPIHRRMASFAVRREESGMNLGFRMAINAIAG